MALPWCPLPRALLTSPRARMLSLDAVGALFVAWSLADDTGTVQPALDCTAIDALVFVAAQHAREAAGTDEAHTRAIDAVNDLLDGGLIVAEGDALRLDGWVHLDGAPQPRPSAPPPPAGDAPTDAPRAPGRPRKAAPMTPAERKRRERFEARVGGFAGVPPGVTWERWCHENSVTKTPVGCHENSAAVTKTHAVGHENSVTKTPAAPRASSPEDQKQMENKGEGESGTRGTRHEPPSARHENSVTKTPPSFRDIPRCPTVESADPFDADVTLDEMRKASGGRFSSAATSMQMQSFGVIARELIARGHASPDALVKAAGHAPHVAWICRLPGPLTVQRLCADEGRVLIELLTGCATCAECGGDPLASGVIDVAARTGDPALDELEAKRAEWQRKYDEQQAARAAKGGA